MRKRNIKKYAASVCMVLALTLAGCSGTEEAASTVAATEARVNENNTTETTEEAVEETAKFSAGISDDAAISAVASDSISEITVTGHNVEETPGCEFGEMYVAKDTVSITYSAGNPTGLLPQTVSKDCEFYFNKDSSDWELKQDTLTSCDVYNEPLQGSNWKVENLSADILSKLFGDEIPADDTGELYIHFNKKVGLFAFNLKNEKNTSTERFFTCSGTGKMTWVGAAGNVEKSFNLVDGSVTDAGDVNMTLKTDIDTASLDFGIDVLLIPEYEYDAALGNEVEEGKVYIEALPTFEVTSTSIEGGDWKQYLGYRYENKSPELTWESYEGASKYMILMIDKYAANWLHWCELVDASEETHFDEGKFSGTDQGYIGPYPEDPHAYDVYIIALADEPAKTSFKMDTTGGDINSKLNDLNFAADGSIGNVLAIGSIRAGYIP